MGSQPTRVMTSLGAVRGRPEPGRVVFVGIPYAAAPEGPRRFRPPEPHPGWQGELDARHPAPIAWQAPAGDLAMSEDCLHLDVHTPAADGAGRPVLVWIHGGGFVGGHSGLPQCDPGPLVCAEDVVVVSINYRLGAFGWLHLAEHDPRYAGSGNAGLLDQVAALRWVQANIAAFGGDPDRVTVFGQSAGAMSIATLLGMEESRGLFTRAILQSGAAHFSRRPDQAAEMAEAVLRAAGMTPAALATAAPDAVMTAQTQALRTIGLRQARDPQADYLVQFAPVVDGAILHRHPLEAIRAGGGHDVEVLVGSNRDESRYFYLLSPDDELTEPWFCHVLTSFGLGDDALAIYRAHVSEDLAAVRAAVQTDRCFRVPAVRLAEARNVPSAVVTYLYEFRWSSPDPRIGSCHGLENAFIFDLVDRPAATGLHGPNPSRTLADAMRRAWAAFARSGSPGHPNLPTWLPYGARRRTMVLDEVCHLEEDPEPERRQLWSGVL